MKVLLIISIFTTTIVGCSAPNERSTSKIDTTNRADTIPVPRPPESANKMPVLMIDTNRSNMPVIHPPDSIQQK